MTVELTRDGLGIINSALNEVCNGIHLEGEFDTRMIGVPWQTEAFFNHMSSGRLNKLARQRSNVRRASRKPAFSSHLFQQ